MTKYSATFWVFSTITMMVLIAPQASGHITLILLMLLITIPLAVFLAFSPSYAILGGIGIIATKYVRRSGSRIPPIFIAIALFVMLFGGLGMSSRLMMHSTITQSAATDIAPNAIGSRKLPLPLIVLAHAGYNLECQHLCQSLLARNVAERVRIQNPEATEETADYRLEQTATCNLAVKPDALATALSVRLNQGYCLEKVEAAKATDGLLFNRDERSHPLGLGFMDLGNSRSVTMELRDIATGTVLHRWTRIESRALTPIAVPYLRLTGSMMSSTRATIALTQQKSINFKLRYVPWVIAWIDSLNHAETVTITEQEDIAFRYGKDKGIVEKHFAPNPIDVIETFLASEQSAFGKDHATAVAKFAATLGPRRRKTPLTKREIDIAYRVLADRRFISIGPLTNRLRGKAHLFTGILPDLVARLEAQTPNELKHQKSRVGRFIAAMPPDAVKPYAARLITYVESQRGFHVATVMPILGRLGVDVTELFQRHLTAARSNKPHVKIWHVVQAICQADNAIAEPLLGELEDMLAHIPAADYRKHGNFITRASRALIRHGRAERARQLTAKFDREFETQIVRFRRETPRHGFPHENC